MKFLARIFRQIFRGRQVATGARVDWWTGRCTYSYVGPELKRALEAVRAIPLGVPLDDNLMPI